MNSNELKAEMAACPRLIQVRDEPSFYEGKACREISK